MSLPRLYFPAVFVAVFLVVLTGLGPAALAQDAGASRASTGGAQTLEDILRRQQELLGEVTTSPRPGTERPEGTAAPITDQLGPRGGDSVSDIWNRMRGGDPVDILSPPTTSEVMTVTGQQWRLLRENYLRKYLGWLPLGVFAVLAAYFLLRGPIRISGGRSGKTIPRFDLTARIAHWFLAGVFIILGVTGLCILLGRPLLAPVLGLEVNAVLVGAAMQGHNLLGPLFIIALFWMFVKFVRGNFFQIVDLSWILKLGGFFGGHASSRKFNFAEKSWFWMVILIGGVVATTGIIMLFPWLVDDLRWLQFATVLHVLGAVSMIAVALGHIYVGTVGMEGSIDAMLKGEVDENWAKEHHDLWYEEVTGKPATEKEASA